MGRSRVKQYHDVFLREEEVKRLRKGYTVSKRVNGIYVSLHARDRKTQREIEKLKKKLALLQGK